MLLNLDISICMIYNMIYNMNVERVRMNYIVKRRKDQLSVRETGSDRSSGDRQADMPFGVAGLYAFWTDLSSSCVV